MGFRGVCCVLQEAGWMVLRGDLPPPCPSFWQAQVGAWGKLLQVAGRGSHDDNLLSLPTPPPLFSHFLAAPELSLSDRILGELQPPPCCPWDARRPPFPPPPTVGPSLGMRLQTCCTRPGSIALLFSMSVSVTSPRGVGCVCLPPPWEYLSLGGYTVRCLLRNGHWS